MAREPQNNRQFFAVPIATFRETSRAIPFDVYLHISGDHYAHVFSKTTGLDYKRLVQFENRGVKNLHLRESERKVYEEFIAASTLGVVDRPSEPLEKKITALLNLTEQNLSEVFFQTPLRAESVIRTREIVKRYVNLMANSPLTLAKILSLVSRGEYLYFHSIAVSVFSLFIAQKMGKMKEAEIESVGLGAFLHDLGFSRLHVTAKEYPEEIDEMPAPLIKGHVDLGLIMLEEAGTHDEALLQIVAQHHERPDGLGYPNAIQGDEIGLGARIVSAADMFSILISRRAVNGALTPEQAIAKMRTEAGRFDPEVLGTLEKIFVQGRSSKAA